MQIVLHEYLFLTRGHVGHYYMVAKQPLNRYDHFVKTITINCLTQ